jgi:ribosomal protein S18 acetylase RimI-like enzyme
VTEVSLAGVPADHYTVSASSDVSIVAAARVTRGVSSDAPSDVAWSASGVRLGSQHVVPVPQGGDRILVFGALADRATISYAAITSDGKLHPAASADIAGETTTSITIPETVDDSVVVGYVVSASGDAAYGALLLEQDGREDISSLAFMPAASGQEKVPVTLGY